MNFLQGSLGLLAALSLAFVLPVSGYAQSSTTEKGFGVGATAISEESLAALAATGARSVRLQYFNLDSDTDDSADYLAWVAEVILNLQTTILPLLEKYQMSGMVAFHSPPGGRDEDASPPIDRIFLPQFAWAQDTLVESWRQVAALCNSHPNIFGYQILSEPGTQNKAALTSLTNRIISAIQGADTTPVENQPHIILAAPYGNPSLVRSIPLPQVPGNFALSVNMYYPQNYTHQGIYFDREIEYPGCSKVTARKRSVKGRAPHSTARAKLSKKKRVSPCSLRGLTKVLSKARALSLREKLPVVIAEYAVAGWAPGAEKYLKDTTSLFKKYGWHSYYHIWREGPGSPWDVEYDGTRTTWAPSQNKTELLQTLEGYFRSN